jgi:hypothetical protein
MRDSNWLCMDCSKDTFDEYYGVHNHLWRRAVDRSQRHGMLCLECLERRLGRVLQLEDFKPPVNQQIAKLLTHRPTSSLPSGPVEGPKQSDDAFDDSPMDWGDYGLIDELTPDAICQIDAALMSLATSKPRKVAAIIRHVMEHSPARVPGLPDYFYLERMRLLVESGVLRLLGDIEDPMRGDVCLP